MPQSPATTGPFLRSYTHEAVVDALVQLTHMCHTAKERGDAEALADYRARRNLVRAELLRRCES